MYSVVMMMALTNGVDTTPALGRRGCHGCNGGYASCCGCYGGGYGYGCYGGCWGGYGGCYGGYGGRYVYGGYGGYGGYAGYGGYGGYGGYVGYGPSGYGYSAGYMPGSVVYPATTSGGVESGRTGEQRPGTTGTTGTPGTSGRPGGVDRGREQRQEEGGVRDSETPRRETRLEVPATLVVHLPAQARLTVDGNPTRSTSSVRTFISPPLPAGNNFYYTLKAEILEGGASRTLTKQVTVRAGQEAGVWFDFASDRVAQK
jgi:uncharacterized protein (TIGR03000 family)